MCHLEHWAPLSMCEYGSDPGRKERWSYPEGIHRVKLSRHFTKQNMTAVKASGHYRYPRCRSSVDWETRVPIGFGKGVLRKFACDEESCDVRTLTRIL
jgi:hypothetical protein